MESGKGEGGEVLPNHIALVNALTGGPQVALCSSPFTLWAALKILHVVPGCNDHHWNQATLLSPASFVLWPTLVPVGG